MFCNNSGAGGAKSFTPKRGRLLRSTEARSTKMARYSGRALRYT